MSPLIRNKHLYTISRVFWGIVFSVIITIAIVIQLARQAFPLLNDYRDLISKELGDALGVVIAIEEIDARWSGTKPKLKLKGLRVRTEDDLPIFEVKEASAELSLIPSLRHMHFAWERITFNDFDSHIVQKPDGLWEIPGYEVSTPDNDSDFHIDDPFDVFLFGRRVDINNIGLTLDFRDGRSSRVHIPKLALENDRFFHRLSANIALDENPDAFRLIVEGYGDPRNDDEFTSKGYLSLDDFPIEKVAAVFGIDLDSEQVSGETNAQQRVDLSLWFSGSPKDGIELVGNFETGSQMQTLYSDIPLPKRLQGNFTGDWKKAVGGEFNLQDISVDWLDTNYSIERISVFSDSTSTQTDIGFRLDELNLDNMSKHFSRVLKNGLPKINEIISALDLEGSIEQLSLRLRPKEDGYFLAQGIMRNGSTKSFRASPTITGINGFVEASLLHGTINLATTDGFSLFLPQLYESPLKFETAKGFVDWRVDLENKSAHVNSSLLEVSNPGEKAFGLLSLSLPFKKEIGEAWMTLLIGANGLPAKDHKKYVPKRVPIGLQTWLGQSIQRGTLIDGSFIYNGPIVKKPSIFPNIQVAGNVENVELKFQSQWPSVKQVKSYLHYDNDRLDVLVDSGDMLGVRLKGSQVVLEKDDHSGPFVLKISTKGEGKAQDGKNIIVNSSLPLSLKETISNWDLKGLVGFNADFRLPIEKTINLDYNLNLNLDNVDLTLEDLRLPLKNITGNVNISRDGLVSSEKIDGRVFDKEFSAEIFSKVKDKILGIDFTSLTDVGDVYTWLKRPELQFFEGITQVDGMVRIPLESKLSTSETQKENANVISLINADEAISVALSSELLGVSINLPEPFKKSIDEPIAFSSQINLNSEGKSYHFILGSLMSALVSGNNDGEYAVGIALNDGKDSPILDYTSLFSIEQRRKNTIFVSGALEQTGLLDWLSVKDDYLSALDEFAAADEVIEETENVGLPFHVKLNLDFDNFLLGSLNFKKSRVLGSTDPEKWNFNVDSENVKGDIYMYHDKRPLRLVLDSLTIPKKSNDSDTVSDEQKVLAFQEYSESSASGIREGVTDQSETSVESFDENVSDITVSPSKTFSGESQSFNASLERQSVLTDIDLTTLPAMVVSIGTLNIGADDFGSWSFDFNPIKNGVVFEKLFANVRGLKLVGVERNSADQLGESTEASGARFTWICTSEDVHSSHIVGQLKTSDLDKVLSAWGQEKLMDADSFSMVAELDWSGAPDQVSLDGLYGEVDFKLREGNFIRGAEAGENPLLRLFALLNFDTLARRLRLDFSDLAARGFSFDKVDGSVSFDKGVMYLAPPLTVESSSSSMQLAGTVDLMEEQVDAELVATLPVGSNAAFATAFIAGLPAAIGVYAVSKLFREQVDKVSSLNYGITGNWTAPKIKVKKIFNNTAAKKKSRQAKEKFDAQSVQENPSQSVEKNSVQEGENTPKRSASPSVYQDTSSVESSHLLIEENEGILD